MTIVFTYKLGGGDFWMNIKESYNVTSISIGFGAELSLLNASTHTHMPNGHIYMQQGIGSSLYCYFNKLYGCLINHLY